MLPGPLLQVEGLTRVFPGVRALDGVRLEVARGTVHALVGENGAGKSTLMRILAGLDVADSGMIHFKGQAFVPRHPVEALRLGISMIHQELLPFPEMTVAENIFMGHEPTRGPLGWIDRGRMEREAAALLSRVGASVAPSRRMGELGVADMQLVEIAKAMAHRAELLIMDEPTSALSAREVESLFGLISELKASGVSVIYISHRFEEIFRIADEVTVLRDGRFVGSGPIGSLDEGRLISMMVGRELGAGSSCGGPVGERLLEVRGLSRRGMFRDVSFCARGGEVVGIAGLMGAGRTGLLRAIYGLAPADAGEIRVRGVVARIVSPRCALVLGIALVGDDRKGDGLVGGMSVKHNLTLASLGRCCRGPFIDPSAEDRVADEQMAALGIRAPHRDAPVEFLSGGNQQKVVIAKALLAEPNILLLDEPTRGIDIAAKAEVHEIIRGLARSGKAVVVVSSEMPEIFALSGRILVMRGGELSGELDPRRATQEDVMRLAMRN
ncbi:MAG TPA: sugar ABC transporter ATP-binding protein [Verrucomicrobiae bacterium]|mgnify:CR=1 FL=1|nr:sugar ABC transporter ATP-binding protein [Verrucomicrobiae bacterium]